jgi:hypothetical protein
MREYGIMIMEDQQPKAFKNSVPSKKKDARLKMVYTLARNS